MVNQSIVTNIATGIKNLITNEIFNHANTTANSSTKGHVQSATNPPQDISNTSAIGTDNGYYARADHVHKASFENLADVPSSFTPASHSHGNLKNDGTVTSNYSSPCNYFAGFDSNYKLFKCNKLYSSKIVNSSALSNIGSDSSATQSTINSKINTALGNKANTNHTHSSSNITDLIDVIYPIGSVYMTFDAFFSPNSEFGGTWERVKGKFLIGADDTSKYPCGGTGGEETHTLTVNEIPNHDHRLNGWELIIAQNGNTGNTGLSSGSLVHPEREDAQPRYVQGNGGGAAHNNIPPYIAVNIWQRVA